MKGIQQAFNDYVSENNTTKDVVAAKLGFSRSTFFMKLRGDSEFSLSEAHRVAQLLGCSMEDLFAMTQAV